MLCVQLTPQGAPGSYRALDTPCGQPFVGAPADFSASMTGGSVAFVPPAKTAERGVVTMVCSFQRGGAQVLCSHCGLFLSD